MTGLNGALGGRFQAFWAFSDGRIQFLRMFKKHEKLLFFAMLLVAVLMPGVGAKSCVCACTGIRWYMGKGADCGSNAQVCGWRVDNLLR